jgi:hypothetical protein
MPETETFLALLITNLGSFFFRNSLDWIPAQGRPENAFCSSSKNNSAFQIYTKTNHSQSHVICCSNRKGLLLKINIPEMTIIFSSHFCMICASDWVKKKSGGPWKKNLGGHDLCLREHGLEELKLSYAGCMIGQHPLRPVYF